MKKQGCVLLSLGASLGYGSKREYKSALGSQSLRCPEHCFLATRWLQQIAAYVS